MAFTEGRPLNRLHHICKIEIGLEQKSLTPSPTWVLPSKNDLTLFTSKNAIFPPSYCVLPTPTTKAFFIITSSYYTLEESKTSIIQSVFEKEPSVFLAHYLIK